MKPNPNLDELLSSFMDGELSPRQRTEVQRMAAHDPAVARRLRQLENCRTMFCALPPAEAPGDLLEQIRQSLERKTLLQEQPGSARRSAGVMHLVFRKFVAAAAMVALLAVLGGVVYQVLAPVSNTETPLVVATSPAQLGSGATGGQTPAVVVADAGFSGRLELRTAALASTDTSVGRVIDSCGLVNLAEDQMAGDRRVYRVVGSRQDIKQFVAALGGVWQECGVASLQVDRPDATTAPVTIEAVTPDQVVTVIARDHTEASVETAEAYAVMNRLANRMPGHQIVPLLREDPGRLWAMTAVPKPKLTGGEQPKQTTHSAVQGSAQASLTIVLLRTK